MQIDVRIVRDQLVADEARLVLVESCTAGWVAAEFGVLPGVSDVLCGSMVVYRNASKHEWLGISQALLVDPNVGPVSELVTVQLAIEALKRTSEATIAAAVTGHLGPSAPSSFDGVVFTVIAKRDEVESVSVRRHLLLSPSPMDGNDCRSRRVRQEEAGKLLISHLYDVLVDV